MCQEFPKTSAVVPTPVGVNRYKTQATEETACRPHARGGEPYLHEQAKIIMLSSPRPWG